MENSDYKSKILEYFKSQNKEVFDDSDLFVSGMLDSIDMVDLVMYLEETFKIKIPQKLLTLQNFNTPKKIAKVVENCSSHL